MQAEIQAALEAHQSEMLKHVTAAENTARLAEANKPSPHGEIVERIVDRTSPQPQIVHIEQSDRRTFIDQSQTDARSVGIDARSVTMQEFLTRHNTEVALYAAKNNLTVNQALQQKYHLGRRSRRAAGQGGRHLIDLVKENPKDLPLTSGGDDRPLPATPGASAIAIADEAAPSSSGPEAMTTKKKPPPPPPPREPPDSRPLAIKDKLLKPKARKTRAKAKARPTAGLAPNSGVMSLELPTEAPRAS